MIDHCSILAATDGGVACLIIAVIVIGITVLPAILSAIAGKLSKKSTVEQVGGLKAFHEQKDLGDGATVTLIALRGALMTPFAPTRARISLILLDITDGAANPMPVVCLLEDLATEQGMFHSVVEADIPYRQSNVQRLHAGFIPNPLIVCPRRGRRRLRAIIDVQVPLAGTIAMTEHDFDFDAVSTGYKEAAEQAASARVAVSKIAFATAAADGNLAESELKLIESLFKQRFNTSGNDKLKQEFRETFRSIHRDIESRSKSPHQLVREALELLKDDAAMRELAFEFSVRISAADGALAPEEDRFLQNLGRDLAISAEQQRSTREKFIRLSMYAAEADSNRPRPVDARSTARTALGMPPGLDEAEQRKWLTNEYRKWNGRVTNSDPAIREEAEARLRAIAQLRAEL